MGKYDHLIDDFVKEYESGKSIRAIAEKYGVAKGTVSHVLRGRVELRPKSIMHTLSEEEQYAIYRSYITGDSIYSISKKYTTSATTIIKLLSVKYGLTVDTKRKYEHLVPHIVKDYADGMSLAEIANKYGISSQCALTYINLEGKEARKYSEASSQTETDTTYFDVLDKERAFTLGVVYARGTALTFNTSKFVHILVKDYEIEKMLKIVNRFVSKSEDNLNRCDKSTSKTIRICSVEMYDKLLSMGYTNRLPDRMYLGKYTKDFLDGFFAFCVSPTGKTLRIKCRDYYKNDIRSYLDSIGVGYWTHELVVGKKSDIIQLVKKHPIILGNIKKYVADCKDEQLKDKWSKIIQEIMKE